MKVMKRTVWATVADLIPIDSFNDQDSEVPLFEIWINNPQLVAKNFKNFAVFNGTIYHRATSECWLEPYSWLRQKKNYFRLMTFFVVRITLALRRACRGKGFIGLKCLEMLLWCKLSVRNARNLSTWGIFVKPRDWRLEKVTFGFLAT